MDLSKTDDMRRLLVFIGLIVISVGGYGMRLPESRTEAVDSLLMRLMPRQREQVVVKLISGVKQQY